jgi:hypothetical protein
MLAHTKLPDAVVQEAAFVGTVFVGAVFTVRFPMPAAVTP